MSWIESVLNRVEARLRSFVEGDATGAGFPHKLHRMLERELVSALKTNIRHLSDPTLERSERLLAPDEYTLVLSEVEAQILLTHPAELDRLTHKLESIASRDGITFSTMPVLRVVADPKADSVSILVGFCQPGTRESGTYRLADLGGELRGQSREKLPNAFLIVNGISTFLITEPVINIGRDPSNQLQLDDPQVSRRHAQLRFIQGRFVIFDLDSRSGTFVNGVPVSSHALNPGDVILLARLPIVYGQDDGHADSQTQELPSDPAPPEVL